MNHSFLPFCSYLSSPGDRQHVSLFHILWVLPKYNKMQKVSFFLLTSAAHSPQLWPIICLKTCPANVRKEHFPILFAKGIYFQIKGSCTRTPKHLPQSSLSIWTETCCNVLGAQLCPVLGSFCPLPLSQIWVSELWRKWVDWPDDWAVHTPGALKSLQMSESSGSSGVLAVPCST